MAKEKEATLLLRIKSFGADALDRAGAGLASLASLAAAAGAAVVGFATLAIQNFREQEEATNRLSQSMVNAGTFSTELRDKYIQLAEGLQKVTTFGDEQIISATAIIQQFSKQKEVTEDVLRATLDFAAAKKIDLNTAAELVGKSIGSNTNALGRYGIEINTAATAAEKMAQVTQKLNGTFGGQAEAAAQGLGTIEQLKNRFSDFLEIVGEKIAPTVTAMVTVLSSLFGNMQSNMAIIDAFGKAFEFIAQAALGAKFVISALGAIIGTSLAASIEAVSLLAQGEFKKSAAMIKTGATETAAAVKGEWEKYGNELLLLEDAKYQSIDQKRKDDEEKERLSLENKRKIQAEQANTAALENEARLVEEKQREIDAIGMSEEQKLSQKIAYLDKQYTAETNAANKLKLLRDKSALLDQLREQKNTEEQKKQDEKRVADRTATLNTIATLSSQGNKTLATIGKAAALAQIAIDTPVAIGKALSAAPPPINFALAGAVGAAMAAQAARVTGIQLAQGGIVKATSGGVQATIGEGGKDEAVIPLDDPEARSRLGGGGGVTVIVNGGMLGDPSSAREFAVAVDRELARLRQNNESVSMGGLI